MGKSERHAAAAKSKSIRQRKFRRQFAHAGADFVRGIGVFDVQQHFPEIMSAIAAISVSFMPRVVTAGVPKRFHWLETASGYQKESCFC